MTDIPVPGIDFAKRAAAIKAASLVQSGMKVGLGTGSTTAFAIEELGRRIREEQLDIVGTPTSSSATLLARQHGVPTRPLDELGQLDIALDGADEVGPGLDLIKGRGAAQTREKIVAASASRFIVLADDSKLVEVLGSKMPLPVEVVPMAASYVRDRILEMGGSAEIRLGKMKDGPVVTDQGFWVIDARFPAPMNVGLVNTVLLTTPGVLDHGLFVGMASAAYIGQADGTVRILTA